MGAGVIGVTTAYRLLQDGHQVSLIDARQQPGEGTSRAMAPSSVTPTWRRWPTPRSGPSGLTTSSARIRR
ncbi:FAD-dependent oxidoreductase [Salmonella enterica]|uniref:FAD-dependent oxidoreductase n=1 Tax=Salmonella enterica TaxID=28901 RepID=UPI003CEBE9BC